MNPDQTSGFQAKGDTDAERAAHRLGWQEGHAYALKTTNRLVHALLRPFTEAFDAQTIPPSWRCECGWSGPSSALARGTLGCPECGRSSVKAL